MIRSVAESDCAAIAEIYNHYVVHTVATFEDKPLAPADMAARMGEVRAIALPWLVAEEEGHLAGYAFANKWRGRSANIRNVAVSVYLHPAKVGKGFGSMLYAELFPKLKSMGVHTVIASVVVPNPASVALQVKFGLEKVGHFKELGHKFGRWHDVEYWQRIL